MILHAENADSEARMVSAIGVLADIFSDCYRQRCKRYRSGRIKKASLPVMV